MRFTQILSSVLNQNPKSLLLSWIEPNPQILSSLLNQAPNPFFSLEPNPKSLLFCSTCILHEGPKINFYFSNFLYYPHKNNCVNTTHNERSYEKLMFCPMHSLIPFVFHQSWEIHLISKVWRRCAFHTVHPCFIEHPSPSSLFECFVLLIHISFVPNHLFLTFWPRIVNTSFSTNENYIIYIISHS